MRNIVRGCADFLDDRTLVSPACPAPKGRIGEGREDRQKKKMPPRQLDTFVTVMMRCPSCSSLVYMIRTVRLYPPSASDAVEVTVPSVRDADVSVTLTRRPFTESVKL